ncbi:hypothetical protein A2767_05450 [Candidatus Roizmanbacteria bacterium RIFCSPHIGHO2_01_FULL_35_10]|uniref:Uncharacterized protein n=1 Tax=Candidatus Roizmanbacteria bacterium RIFCSPLOWO2_01_FULL_35_13 TaxID=1802055 RepID=A0A1F7IBK0_9BACT|nr:MAG: hypothetical protein A2767_05450 [Candidatus Roizmanbacteria bacterium RIFCSPHIGHO2_01_FULL_35_10]OGK40737.1 MAG: hypothetical protein A3A74_03920 [Candidatus Roizmanbacteria bacterium RIFCSPLOWO2_01_FULL_35_13]
MDPKGLLLCVKYSSAPNFFGYCGPEENASLIDHLKEKVADKEVKIILSQFETLYSYLKLISTENKIPDPFNEKVVEAYWIGNSLLDNISNKNYSYLLQEELNLEKKMGDIKFQKVKSKILSSKFYPHHAFHVFNIFKRTGIMVVNHTLETMDSCRIGFGQIINLGEYQISNIKNQKNRSKIKNILVKAKQLTINNYQLIMSRPDIKELKIDYKGKSFLPVLKVGDWVSFHWGFVCDVLTLIQVKNLDFYTKKAIEFFNS